MRTVKGSMKVMLVALLCALLFVGVWFFYQKQKSAMPVTDNVETREDTGSQKGPMIGGAETESGKTIRENLVQSKDHTTFVVLSQTVALMQLLEEGNPITVFAPNNIAFGRYTPEAFQMLLKSENQPMLKELLQYHIVPGTYRSSDFKEGMKMKTIQGGELTLTKKEDGWWLNGNTRIGIADIASKNGVVHSVDAVISAAAPQQ